MPAVVLRTADGNEQVGRHRTGCWTESTIACGDSPGTPFSPEPLVVKAGAILQLDFSQLGTPTNASYRVYRYGGAVKRLGHNGELMITPQLSAVMQQGALPLADVVDVRLEVPPDHYAIEVISRHPRVETTEGFNVVVEP